MRLTEDPVDWAYHLILPWITLAVLYVGFYSRVLRSNMLDVMNEDYVRTARAKGLSERQVMTRHVLRNSLIPIVTLFGLDFGAADRRQRDHHRSRSSASTASALYAAEAIEQPRPAADHGGHPLRRLLRRPLQRPGRHRLRLPRPAGPARGASAQ